MRQGRSEPIGLGVTAGKKGIGRVAHDNHRQAEKFRKRKRAADAVVDQFRVHQKSSVALRKTEKAVLESKNVARSLDERAGVTDNPLTELTEEEKEEQEGSKITDPFPSYDRRELPVEVKQPRDQQEAMDELTDLLNYLRTSYCYCFYCAITFDDDRDLALNCPGVYDDDHDEDALSSSLDFDY